MKKFKLIAGNGSFISIEEKAYKSKPERLVAELKDAVLKTLSPFTGDMVSPVLLGEVKVAAMEAIQQFLSPNLTLRDKVLNNFDFEVEQIEPTEVSITPKNLYTFLTLYGIYVEPEDVRSNDEYKVKGMGTFSMVNGRPLVKFGKTEVRFTFVGVGEGEFAVRRGDSIEGTSNAIQSLTADGFQVGSD